MPAAGSSVAPSAVTSAELSASFTKHWATWHPDPVSHEDYPWRDWDDVDKKVRNMVLIMLDRLYDELTAQGMTTGEIITFAMFLATIEGYLP